MSKEEKKISIVVPIYNASLTIERCINSILSQTYKNIEVIIIDDGSSDNGLEICRQIQSKDSRIIIENQPNAGVSVARNRGIDIATGDYIAFVDSDDYIKPDMYEKLIDIAEDLNVQLVFCNYEEVDDNSIKRQVDQLSSICKDDNTVDNIDIIENMLLMSEQNIMGSCWRTLFKLYLLHAYSIRFTVGIKMSEDLKFMLECLEKNKISGICKEYLYCFYVAGFSTTRKYMNAQDVDMEFVNEWMSGLVARLQTFRNLQLHMKICLANTIVTNAANICRKFSPYSVLERVRYIDRKRKEESYRMALKIAVGNKKMIKRNRWIQMSLIRFNLGSLVILYHTLKNKTFTRYTE